MLCDITSLDLVTCALTFPDLNQNFAHFRCVWLPNYVLLQFLNKKCTFLKERYFKKSNLFVASPKNNLRVENIWLQIIYDRLILNL